MSLTDDENLNKKLIPFNINEILYTYPIGYVGWECDEFGYIVLFNDGTKGIIETSHGYPKIVDVTELYQHISLYNNLIEDTNEAIRLLNL